MQSVRTPTDPGAPASAARPWAAWSQRIARLAPRWPGTRTDGPVSALMLGATSVLAVRVEPALQTGGRLRLLAAMELPVDALNRLREERICTGSRTVLVLPQEQRQLLAIERPEVPDAELPLPEDCVDSQERLRVFCRAMRRLPVQCRRALLLKKVYGLDRQEVARHLGISESTVQKHICKGMALIVEYMDVRELPAVPRRSSADEPVDPLKRSK